MFYSVRPPNSLGRVVVGRYASTLESSNFVFLRKTSHDFYFAALQRIRFWPAPQSDNIEIGLLLFSCDEADNSSRGKYSFVFLLTKLKRAKTVKTNMVEYVALGHKFQIRGQI